MFYVQGGKVSILLQSQHSKIYRFSFLWVWLYKTDSMTSIPMKFQILVAKQNRESTKGYSESIVRNNNNKFGKGLVSTSRTYASSKGTGSASPVGMPHQSQMFYGNHSKFGKRPSSVQSLISRGLSLYMVRSQNVI